MRLDPEIEALIREDVREQERARKIATPAAASGRGRTGSAAMAASGNASTQNIRASVSEAAEAADTQQGVVKGTKRKRPRAEANEAATEELQRLERLAEREASVSVAPPRFGQFLICVLVPPNRQAERLGDYDERFHTLWAPRFGPRLGRVLYTVHAIQSAAAIVRIATVAMLIDGLKRALGF